MLKGIPKIITPELLKVLCEMGHGDEIVISDGNFPGNSIGRQIIRYDAIGVPQLLKAVLELIPLDSYADNVFLMDKTESDKNLNIPIWEEYKAIVAEHTEKPPVFLERFEFYERAKKAYAVVVTGEEAIYVNIILKQGIVK